MPFSAAAAGERESREGSYDSTLAYDRLFQDLKNVHLERYAPLLRDAGVHDDPSAIKWAASEKGSTFTIAEINKFLLSEGKGVFSALTEVRLLEALRGI